MALIHTSKPATHSGEITAQGLGTNPFRDSAQKSPAPTRPINRGSTDIVIYEEELGEDQLVSVDTDQIRVLSSVRNNVAHGSRVRSELCRAVLARLRRLAAVIGENSAAGHLELLKRELSHCHDALLHRESENNFLSIVTLVEGALASQRWNKITSVDIELFRSIIEIGYEKVSVEHDDYLHAVESLRNQKIRFVPEIDLAAFDEDDGEND